MPTAQPEKPPSYRENRLASAKARRAERVTRREQMLDLIISGCDYGFIAQHFKVSLKTVKREVDLALDRRPLTAPDRYVRVQVERLSKVLRRIDLQVDSGNLNVVKPLIEVLERLDRYHGLAGFSVARPQEAKLRLSAPSAPLALTLEAAERTEAGA